MGESKGFRVRRLFPDHLHGEAKHWCVLGLGRVTPGPGLHASRIEVVAAPLLDARALGGAFSMDALDLVHMATAYVPVSLMGFFFIGDVWHEGLPVGELRFLRRTLKLNYQLKGLGFAQAGLSRDDGGRWLLPPDDYPLGALLPHAQLTTISDGKYPYRYLIPCACLLSFYYGGSSELYRTLFRPGFGKPNNPVFDPGLTQSKDRELHLHLRPGVPIEDARVISAWTTEYGLAQVARIYESVLVPRDGTPGYLRVLPPFQGKEQLEVDGVELGAGSPYARFLILRIRSGSLPVPYNRIVVANPELAIQEPGEPENVGDDEDELPPPPPRSPKQETELTVVPGDVPGAGSRETIKLQTADRFRDKVEVSRLTRPRQPRRQSPGQPPVPPTSLDDQPPTETKGAVGGPDVGSTKRVVVITTNATGTSAANTGRARSPTFGTFHDGLDALDPKLEQPHGIIILEGLGSPDGDPCASLFPTKHAELDAYHAWYYRQRSRARRRKLIIAGALYRRCWFALLEPEEKPHEDFQLALACSGLFLPPDKSLASLAAAAAANNCIWPEGRFLGLDVRRQKHIWGDDPEAFVAAITTLMDAMLALD